MIQTKKCSTVFEYKYFNNDLNNDLNKIIHIKTFYKNIQMIDMKKMMTIIDTIKKEKENIKYKIKKMIIKNDDKKYLFYIYLGLIK